MKGKMTDKVKELVGRWAKCMALYKYGGTEKELYPHWILAAKGEVLEMLSGEPDLALIDRERGLPTPLYSEDEKLDPKWVEEATKQDMLQAKFLPIIPLADAIKEMER